MFQTLGWPPACGAGEENPSDLGTKGLGADRIWKLMGMLGFKSMDGRPEGAPLMKAGAGFASKQK